MLFSLRSVFLFISLLASPTSRLFMEPWNIGSCSERIFENRSWIREKNTNHKRCWVCVCVCRTFGHISRYRNLSHSSVCNDFCTLWRNLRSIPLHLGAILILNHISVRPVIIWGRRYRYRIHIYSLSLGYCLVIIENSFYSFTMTNLKILIRGKKIHVQHFSRRCFLLLRFLVNWLLFIRYRRTSLFHLWMSNMFQVATHSLGCTMNLNSKGKDEQN